MAFYCPFCKSKKKMVKDGKAFDGKGVKRQRYLCKNKNCKRTTIHPLRRKP